MEKSEQVINNRYDKLILSITKKAQYCTVFQMKMNANISDQNIRPECVWQDWFQTRRLNVRTSALLRLKRHRSM